jgi:RimJ/RimL family protein N-acetyltransferase
MHSCYEATQLFARTARVIGVEFQIHTERLVLRPWTDDDVPPFLAMVLDPRFGEYMLPVAGPDAARDWVRRKRAHFDRHGFGPWVVELVRSGEFLGCVGLSTVPYEAAFTPAVEFGWRLARSHRGHGYATEAARHALADGFGRLGLREIVASTVPANWPSRRIMQRLGMDHVAGGDFDHPAVPVGHPLRRQVLYRAIAPGSNLA